MRPSTFRGRGMLLACAALLLSACVYRLDTQQGNILDVEQVDQVEVGMTRSQVRFVLGTPMVADPFDQSRWDYVYWQRKGKGGQEWKSQITVWFDGDKVARLERAGQPRPPGAADEPKQSPEGAAPPAPAGEAPPAGETPPAPAGEAPPAGETPPAPAGEAPPVEETPPAVAAEAPSPAAD